MIYYILAAVLTVLLTFKKVKLNETHIVSFLDKGKKIYSNDTGVRSSYLYIPFLMNRVILDNGMQSIDVLDVKVNDKHMGHFKLEFVVWYRIFDVDKANRSFDVDKGIKTMATAMITEEIAKLDVTEVSLSASSIAGRVKEGLDDYLMLCGYKAEEVVILNLSDIEGFSTIKSYQLDRDSEMSNKVRKTISERDLELNYQLHKTDQDAALNEIQSDKEIEIKRAEERRELESLKHKLISKTLDEDHALDKKKTKIKEECLKEDIRLYNIEADAKNALVKEKAATEVKAKEAVIKSMNNMDDKFLEIERIKAQVDVEKARYKALGEALKSADLKLVQFGAGDSIFGLPMDNELGQDLYEILQDVDLDSIKEKLSNK